MGRVAPEIRKEVRFAKLTWGDLGHAKFKELRFLLEKFHLSVICGDVICLHSSWYITHSGLLRTARRNRCTGIRTNLQRGLSDPERNRWIFKAVVYDRHGSKGFVGYGDADPSNVSSVVHGAELRVAETRAVNRALRKAYGIGICSVEELGSPREPEPATSYHNRSSLPLNNGHPNGQPRLRDRLCLLVRKHQLDSTLVKRYAADFCGTEALRDAGRELIEDFINNLAVWACKDRDGLLCKLNSYSQAEEVRP